MNSLDEIETTLREAIKTLPDGLREHILRVEAESRWLAEAHGVDEHRAVVAALGHDLVRHLTGPELLAMASRYGLTPDAIETESPVLVHGPVAARILSKDYGFQDSEVIAAIDCHTTARGGMSALEQVLFVADKVEPRKREGEPAIVEVRELARESLPRAVLRYLDYNLEQAARRGWIIHPRSDEAREKLLAMQS